MTPKRPEQVEVKAPDAKPKNRRAKGSINVWLGPEYAERMQKAKGQIRDKIGFAPSSNTDVVMHLLDRALKEYEKERGEISPPKLL